MVDTMIKKAIRAIAPAPIWTALNRWRWGEKCYWTWGAACRAAGSYDNDMLTRFRIARATQPEPIGEDHPLAVAIMAMRNPKVTDFGGGIGDLAKSLRLRFPNAEVTIVEHPGMAAIHRPEDGVRWTSRIPATCDVFFSSGTLQYLGRPYRTLNAGFASARSSVILMRNSFSKRSIIRVQRCSLFENGSGPVPAGFDNIEISYPHRTVKEERVIAIARRNGFDLASRCEADNGVLPYYDEVYGQDLVFRRHIR